MLEEDNTEINDIHNYTMCLPESYYESGSYTKWIRVGWALKNVDFRMFTVWMKFSCQWSDFSFNDIPDLFEEWKKFDLGDNCKTQGSIVFWARDYWTKKSREDPDIENEFNIK